MTKDANTQKNETPAPPAPQKPPLKPIEIGGRDGLDPVRYGDWEVGGIAKDF